MTLQLRNPHSILAAFRERARSVIDVRLPAGRASDAWAEVERVARAERIPVVATATADERSSRRQARDAGGGRGGVAEATVKERPEVTLEELFEIPADAGHDGPVQRIGPPKLWLALDQVQDPHNVGAIFRTAAFFGVAGIIITRDRSSPLNATVYDVASGGVEVVPHSHPVNLSRSIEVAKRAGLWVLGASEHAEKEAAEIDRERSWLLVVGNEERGLRRLTADQCDELCCLRARGSISSLNVSVAAGVLMAVLTNR